MHIEPLSLDHQDLLENAFHLMNLSLSEYSFANLYLFRQVHQYEVIRWEDSIFIKGITRDKVPFIMLTSSPERIAIPVLRQVSSLAEMFFPIPENWLVFFEKILLQANFQDDDNDYLYAASKFVTYAGRHLDGPRYHVKQLLHHHEVRSENLSEQFIDAYSILDLWHAEYSNNLSETDYFSCKEAIHLFHRLHLHGRIVYIDQKPAGFVIGEWISKDCYAIHFSKALRSIKGVYQYLFQDLAREIGNLCKWINLEQDLGIPTLRYSKFSYHPDDLAKKWRIKIN